ncbi:12758_t:CDS:2 [Cetraspora pellucida]|uniref:12758_t:CDS:1 n=1 Tax=Cetraspora pellucida TaxID=1433469 RepID=A0ACA9M2S3_9GLOM|nr:12758_t:CDS:2 [Cetraspora pellucida]
MEPIIIKSSAIAISPQKMNEVAGIIRKKKLDYSLKVLEFLPKKGGQILYKLLAGVAKSLEKNQEKPANFYLQKVEVNQGKIQKRNDNNNSHALQAKVEIKKEIDKKESLLEQAKIDGDNEVVAKLEQQLQELKNQQKNNSTAENPNENKIIAYSIIGLSLMTFIGLIIILANILIRPHLTEAEIILLLDKNNSKLETVLKGIYKIVKDEKISVKVDLKKVKKIYAHAQSIANLISGQLKKWIPVKQILKNVLAKVEYEPEIKGGGVEMKEVGSQVAVLSRGLQAQQGAELTEKQLEAIRKVVSGYTKKYADGKNKP